LLQLLVSAVWSTAAGRSKGRAGAVATGTGPCAVVGGVCRDARVPRCAGAIGGAPSVVGRRFCVL